MQPFLTEERQHQVLARIRQSAERDVKPVARDLDTRDKYPFAIVERQLAPIGSSRRPSLAPACVAI